MKELARTRVRRAVDASRCRRADEARVERDGARQVRDRPRTLSVETPPPWARSPSEGVDIGDGAGMMKLDLASTSRDRRRRRICRFGFASSAARLPNAGAHVASAQ